MPLTADYQYSYSFCIIRVYMLQNTIIKGMTITSTFTIADMTHTLNSLVHAEPINGNQKKCLACGGKLGKRRRRYCSKECKDRLVFALGWLKNFLLALNTNYATFSFSDQLLVVNVLPHRSRDVFSFFYDRKDGRTPAEDLKTMCLDLSREWYHKNQQTRCRNLASMYVLNKQKKGLISRDTIRPLIRRTRTNVQQQLKCLKLSIKDVDSDKSEERVKAAYRREAMRTHPDIEGGDGARFRIVSEAYHELITWLKKPTFICERGVPEKWSYDGAGFKWRTPL